MVLKRRAHMLLIAPVSDRNTLKAIEDVYPIAAKVGGLHSQGAKGEAAVYLLRTIDNAGSGVLRLSRRAKKMA